MALVSNKDLRCYVCGPNNPLGLRVSFSPDSAQEGPARYTARPEHAGWNGILHSRITFALMDEALGWSLYDRDLPAVTARVETRFHKPIAVGVKLIVKAWVVKQRRRLLAQADATMCLIGRRTEFEAS